MTAPELANLEKLEAEVARRIVHGGDDPQQVAKDTGAPLELVYAVRMLPTGMEE